MSVLHIKSAGEASVHVVVFLDDVGIHRGIVAGRQYAASSVVGRQYAANCRGDKLWDAAAAAPSARSIVRERRAWVASVALLHGTSTATATASSPTSTRRASVVEGLECAHRGDVEVVYAQCLGYGSVGSTISH
jgi:hypothetical protein